MTSNIKHSITISSIDIENLLNKLFSKESMKDSYVRLFKNLINESPRVIEYITKIHFGTEFIIPEVGMLGYIPIEALRYSNYYNTYCDSEFIQHGYLPCKITEVRSLASYGPIVVQLPEIAETENIVCSSINFDDFYTDEDLNKII